MEEQRNIKENISEYVFYSEYKINVKESIFDTLCKLMGTF